MLLLTEAGHVELKKGDQHELLPHDIIEIDGFKRKNAVKFPDGPRFGYVLIEIAAADASESIVVPLADAPATRSEDQTEMADDNVLPDLAIHQDNAAVHNKGGDVWATVAIDPEVTEQVAEDGGDSSYVKPQKSMCQS